MCIVYLCHPLGNWTTFYNRFFFDWRSEPPPTSYCSTSIWIIPGTVGPL